MPGESFENPCVCVPLNGGVSPTIQPYVVSVNGLKGILTLAAGGGVSISSYGNSILIAADGSAGLGTVTTVNATSSNNNLVVTGGPITTVGTFAFSLAGNLDSISGLTMAADEMLYSTGPGVFVATPLTAFGRSLIDDAAAVNARSTLGLVIGTDVQAWNADLDSFVTNASWAGANLTLAGNISAVAGNFSSNVGIGGTLGVTGAVTFAAALTAGSVNAGTFSGDGAAITGITAANISAGTLAVARGGTGIASYAVGDLLYASAGTTLSKLADVAAGSFLRSGGVATAPAWSTTLWPNTLVTGDILYASSTTQVSRLADVATTNALISGGVGVAPSWGKITLSHTTGIAASGTNADISALTLLADVTTTVAFHQDLQLDGAFVDGDTNAGNVGDILTSTNVGTQWTSQISPATVNVSSQLSLSGTITAAGVTGNRTINKQSGTVRFAAAATTIVITNSLALAASSRAVATVCSNDTTLKSVSAVVTNGFITLNANAAATAETEVYWELRQII